MMNIATSARASDNPGAARMVPIAIGTAVDPRLMKHATIPAPSDIKSGGHTAGNPAHMSWLQANGQGLSTRGVLTVLAPLSFDFDQRRVVSRSWGSLEAEGLEV
jgi:hypothetical protein